VAAGTRIITTLAGNGEYGFSGDGGPATSASLDSPTGLAVDGGGNVLFTDTGNNRIRRVATGTRIITTLAGGGEETNWGSATRTYLEEIRGLAVDRRSGSVFFSTGNQVAKLVWASNAISVTTPSNTPSSSPYCQSSLFRLLPRTDLVGTLVGTALAPGTALTLTHEAACDGYSFDASHAALEGRAHCFLLVNITQLVPSNTMASAVYESAL
jgi:hypothetical protein